ncbi:MAG: hypothetical protein HFG66_19075 [Hungatella sp.]|jgi:hypothetical protein|nr:hypothetical protein [Hungatella sp.]
MGLKKLIKKQIPGAIKQSQVQRTQELAVLSDAQLRLYIPDVYLLLTKGNRKLIT